MSSPVAGPSAGVDGSRPASRDHPTEMKILVDSCSYNCQNVGDLAMLTVAVSRLGELWPSASIQVITNAPRLVARHCGAVETVPVRGRRLLLEEQLLGRIGKSLPDAARVRWDRFEGGLRFQWPGLFHMSLRVKEKLRGQGAAGDAAAFLHAVNTADLLVVNGAGILTDAFKPNALGILATLELAIRRGIPTALFGHGIGPLDDAELRLRVAEVLPRVTLITVREARTSPQLLVSLGVSASNIVVTGDDAIEMALSASSRRPASGRARTPKIGVNVRVAPYADVEHGTLSGVRQALEDAARVHQARMVPIPIAHHGGGMDIDTLRQLLSGVTGADGGGASLDHPQQVIDRIGECRVMVTGSYHGAVFALSQGIPVVALAKSEYYVNKMSGVADQFGLGCEIVRLTRDDGGLPARLGAAIDRAWADADRVRDPLLAAAAEQVQLGRSAYQRLRELVTAVPSTHLAG
jgi:polysaccharide pyruvyl transferase WcaK-like protein